MQDRFYIKRVSALPLKAVGVQKFEQVVFNPVRAEHVKDANLHAASVLNDIPSACAWVSIRLLSSSNC